MKLEREAKTRAGRKKPELELCPENHGKLLKVLSNEQGLVVNFNDVRSRVIGGR